MSAQYAKKGKPKIIGLTGGIASGKSTASAYLKQKGIALIDCDQIVKHLYLEDDQMLLEIFETFGVRVCSSKDKKALSDIIFKSPEKRQLLNDIIHPRVYAKIDQLLKDMKKEPQVIVDMPLLFEVGYQKNCDQTVLIYVPEAIQIKRLISRDAMTLQQAKKRLKSQMPIETKKTMASIVIDNQGSHEDLYKALNQLIQGV
jgi:dephospho-CoA kinase